MATAAASGDAKKKSRSSPNPCYSCKQRHLKCDANQPACSRCKKAGIECNRGYSVRFRHTLNPSVPPKHAAKDKREFVFADDQPWVQTAKSFNFVDETQEVVNTHEAEDSDEPGDQGLSALARVKSSTERTLGSPIYHASSPASARPLTARTSSFGSRERPHDVQHAKKKRALSSVSSIAPTVSTVGEISDLLGQSSVSSHSAGYTDAFSVSSLAESDNIGLQLLLGAGMFLDSNTTYTFPVPEPIILPPAADSPMVDTQTGPLSEIYLAKRMWPLRDGQEAYLFNHYVRVLAPLFDMCDNARHFAKVVPLRAPKCPPLLNAILAASAKRLSEVTKVDSLMVDRYYQECLRTLIPALSSAEAVVDENLLAAIVILRYMEEMDLAFSLSGSQSHLIGTRVFLAAQESACEFSGLRLAAFWVALRQEIFMALIHSRPVHPDLFLLNKIGPLLEATDCDCSYANRVILHCASCISYCFGETEQPSSIWFQLSAYLDEWYEKRPWDLHPMTPEVEGSTFLPEITFLSDAAVAGHQHYHIARLILAAHNPKTPKLGPARRLALDSVNDEAKKIVRIICGIAESNQHCLPAYVCASTAITMAGDRFTDRKEQETLYGILVKTGTQLAWPTDAAQADLREAWGWPKAHEAPGMSIAGLLNTGTPAM